jgi:murein L,D-transpeptidase YcbB/YkuD
MAEYRHTETGEVKTQGQWRSHYSNVSLPRTWKAATLAGLNLEAVLASPAATTGAYQTSARDGVVQDASGNWVENYVARDMFADTTDEDGVTTTKAEHEAAYQAGLDDKAGEAVRAKRNTLLAETDYFALTDVTMDAAMTTYRQALRDITNHANFPNLDDADWPTKP